MTTPEQATLQNLINTGKIAKDSINFAASLAAAPRLSDKQAYWVTKLINDVKAPVARPIIETSKMVKLFEGAKRHLKRPKVTLQTKSGQTLRCAVASERSRYPGSIMLSAGAFGSTFFGSIKVTGELCLSGEGKAIEADLTETLNEFAADPAGTAMKYGKLTSHCCFCNLPLSTPESLAVGYGDTCADHWGVPWGKDKKSGQEILAQVQMDIDNEDSDGEVEDPETVAYVMEQEEMKQVKEKLVISYGSVPVSKVEFGPLNDFISD